MATSGRVPVSDPVCPWFCGGRAESVAADAGNIEEEEDTGGGTMGWPEWPFWTGASWAKTGVTGEYGGGGGVPGRAFLLGLMLLLMLCRCCCGCGCGCSCG